jgi:hypothetical protein
MKVRLASKSPQKTNEKKVSLPNTTSLNKQPPKRTSMPVTNTRSAMNKTRDDGIEVIPFGEDNSMKLDFKKKVNNKSGEEDFVAGLINDGYVE